MFYRRIAVKLHAFSRPSQISFSFAGCVERIDPPCNFRSSFMYTYTSLFFQGGFIFYNIASNKDHTQAQVHVWRIPERVRRLIMQRDRRSVEEKRKKHNRLFVFRFTLDVRHQLFPYYIIKNNIRVTYVHCNDLRRRNADRFWKTRLWDALCKCVAIPHRW